MVLAVSEQIDLDFEVHGKDGDTIVFIPGTNDDRNAWAEVAPAFPQYRRLLFDNRDVGNSARATQPYTIGDMADDTIRLMERAGIERAHVFGHSMGGTIAQEVALRAPGRVRSLVLVGTFAKVDNYMDSALRRWMHWIQTLNSDEFLRNTLYFWVGPDIINEMGMDALVELVRPQVEAQGPEAFCRQVEAVLRHDTTARLGQIQAPTLVVSGGSDMLVPKTLDKQLLDGIPDSLYAVIERSGHSPTIEQPAALNAAIQGFLASI